LAGKRKNSRYLEKRSSEHKAGRLVHAGLQTRMGDLGCCGFDNKDGVESGLCKGEKKRVQCPGRKDEMKTGGMERTKMMEREGCSSKEDFKENMFSQVRCRIT